MNVLGIDPTLNEASWCWIDPRVPNVFAWQMATGKFWEIVAYITTVVLYTSIKCFLVKKVCSLPKFVASVKFWWSELSLNERPYHPSGTVLSFSSAACDVTTTIGDSMLRRAGGFVYFVINKMSYFFSFRSWSAFIYCMHPLIVCL